MKPTDLAIRLTSFLGEYLPAQKNLSPNTIRAYRDAFTLLLRYCRTKHFIHIPSHFARLREYCHIEVSNRFVILTQRAVRNTTSEISKGAQSGVCFKFQHFRTRTNYDVGIGVFVRALYDGCKLRTQAAHQNHTEKQCES